uniref:Major sperm protein n=1 Tax=Meloidogyne floridensis TaxID=298350 RepID=A0A915PEZ3_9BILA
MLLFTPSVAATFSSVYHINKRKNHQLKNKITMSVPSLLFSGEENNEEFSLLNEIHHNQIQSLIDLHKIPDELWLTRKRIEAGVLEQKKQREMLTNIQERLAQCRLERTRNLKRIIERPRSQSPPSERLNRLNALEQQMKRLNLFTAQPISSSNIGTNYSNKIKEEIKQKKIKEIIQEFYELKRNINKLRENTKLQLNETNSLLNQKMGILTRQLKREIILNRRISIAKLEKMKEKEINIFRIENQKLGSLNEENVNKAESAENRLKEIIERICSLPFVNISCSFSDNYDYSSISNLIISIRSAIERSVLNERKKGEASLEAYKVQANEELVNERLNNERKLKNIEIEKRLLFEQEKVEWIVEKNKLINELEQIKTDKSVEIAKIEANIKLIEMDKIKMNNLEENKFTKEISQNNEKHKIEINEYKLNLNDLKTKLVIEQKEHQKSQIIVNQLEEIKSVRNEELITAYNRLSSVESQLAIACQNTEEATIKHKKEKHELYLEQLEASELRLKKEREDWLADAESADRDWKAQNKLITKAETNRKELIKSLDYANSKLAELERKLDSQFQKEQMLRSELLKLKEELAEERIQTENIIEGKEKEFKKELDNFKLEVAEHKVKKAAELCQKLSAELDKLSEKSFNQSTSSEKLLADLEETKGELSIFRDSLENEKRKNVQLETEIRQMEKERIRIENIFERRMNSESKQFKLIEEKRKDNNSIEILIKKLEEKIFGKHTFGELTKRINIIFNYLLKISEENNQRINDLEQELINKQQQIINQKESLNGRNEENKLLKLKLDKTKNELKNKINEDNLEKEYLLKRKTLEIRIEQLEQILTIERAENANEIERIRKELKEERNHSKIIENELLTIKLKTKATITEEVLENKKTTEKEYQLKEKLEQTKIENISLIKRIEIAEKRELESKILETKLSSELHELRLQRRETVKELENLQRELRETKITNQEIEIQLKRFVREKAKFEGKIEALEMDRRRVSAIIKQTTLEKNALNKSLNTMERENSELQKHCRSLQTQVERLEEKLLV